MPSSQVEPADVIIVEGILVLHMQELRAQCNMCIYVDTGGTEVPAFTKHLAHNTFKKARNHAGKWKYTQTTSNKHNVMSAMIKSVPVGTRI